MGMALEEGSRVRPGGCRKIWKKCIRKEEEHPESLQFGLVASYLLCNSPGKDTARVPPTVGGQRERHGSKVKGPARFVLPGGGGRNQNPSLCGPFQFCFLFISARGGHGGRVQSRVGWAACTRTDAAGNPRGPADPGLPVPSGAGGVLGSGVPFSFSC